MSDIYTIGQAWEVLGRDARQIMRIIMNYPSLDERVKVADKILIRARKIAKKLSAKYHPDVNPSNHDAEQKFKNVQLAIKSIEYHTERFKAKVAQIQLENEQSSKTVIVVGK